MGGRRGSALLIVLGFLSFMVVSAVAFSIYMRSERVPSSVFRRNVSIRHLVQSGLAHAMSELDDAIRNDPFPGVVSGGSLKVGGKSPLNFSNGEPHYVDNWFGRVFMPPNPEYVKDDYDNSFMAPEKETVSVVNLEGLGYVPPPLINDVRFLSRRSWAAKWRRFDYAVGRFAYCAVNLSDYFDVNRTSVKEPRTGFNRVSLAPFFSSSSSRLDIRFNDIDTFSSFVSSPGGNNLPLISMLDYACAGGRKGNFGFTSNPFYRWIDDSKDTLYLNKDDDAQWQVFVTDSWYPSSYKAESRPSLNLDATGKARGQPFDLNQFGDLAIAPQPLDKLLTTTFPDATGENGVKFNNMMSGTDIVALYDYLDRDDIPSSLALPTVERNPMVVAISPQFKSLELIVPQTSLAQATDQNTPVTTPVNFDLSTFRSLARSGLNVVLAYPFKHGGFTGLDLDSASYQIQAVVKIFLVEEKKGVGTRGKAFGGNYNNAAFRPSDSDYTGNSQAAGNVLTFVAKPKTITFSGGDEWTKEVLLDFNPLSGGDIPVVEHTSTWVPGTTVDNIPRPGHAESTWKLQFFPLDAEGNVVTPTGYSDGASTLPDDRYVPVMAVWVRVKDVERNFVADCVPATFFEDSFNGLSKNSNLKSALTMQDACGDREPLLRFTCKDGAPAFQYNGISGSGSSPFTTTVPYAPGQQNWKQKTIWAVDPRYNHAPEDWCMETGSELGRQQWESKARVAANSTEDIAADGDIYLAVSNQGFMQSVGEFAFLPRVKERFCDDYEAAGKMWGVRWANLRAADYLNGLAEFSDGPSGSLAKMVWRTYEPWDNEPTSPSGHDNLFGCGIAEDLGGGFVNPYSDDTRVLMAALANTPVNWWAAAGTNTVKNASRGQNPNDTISKRDSNFKTIQKSLKFAYNEDGSADDEDRLLKLEALKKMANGMASAFREGAKAGKTKWEDIYDSWDWTPDGTPFSWSGDNDFRDQLDSIDCRYLHSFWRGCFANRQQLFLIFVRAESMALGGSGEGQIPPQQGGRAVALVWRDPETPRDGKDTAYANERKPHRMRVLFYHQLD